ncbi:holin [Nesterenkonia sp. Hz 6-5]|nr:holin [Nesterenkonia haasae]
MAARVCSTPRCPNLTGINGEPQTGGRCGDCKARADRARRPDGNPYTTTGHHRFRDEVLARDPICTLCRAARSTVADHYPMERVDLIANALDPNDPSHGRGLCKLCHDKHTAKTYSFGGTH